MGVGRILDSSLLHLQNERARLRPLHHDDAVAYAEGTDDAAVREHCHLPEPEYTPASVRAMIDRDVTPGLERGDLAVLAIAEVGTDEFAGSLVIFDVGEDSAEVGFWLHPDHRGSGLTGAALELAVDLARQSGLRELTARTVTDNPASQHVLAAAGFSQRSQDLGTAPSGRSVELIGYAMALTAH